MDYSRLYRPYITQYYHQTERTIREAADTLSRYTRTGEELQTMLLHKVYAKTLETILVSPLTEYFVAVVVRRHWTVSYHRSQNDVR